MLRTLAALSGLGLLCAGTTAANEPSPEQRVDFATLRVSDIDGRPRPLIEGDSTKGIGVVFLSTECPIARKYLPEIGRLAKRFADAGLPVYGAISDRSVSRAEAKQWQHEFQVGFPILFDASGELRARLLPTHTPETFVFLANGTLAYRGRIDNLFGSVGRPRREATKHEFRDALQAVAGGRMLAATYAEPVGCPVEDVPTAASAGVTYCRDVAPILFQNCASCHRAGEVAPFALTSYEDAAKRAKWLSEVTRQRLMPPWKAKLGFGHFEGERFLTDHEIATLAAWADAGAPQGDIADLPPLPKFSGGWELGEPDLIVRMTEPVEVPADGPDLFRHIAIPVELAEDRYVSAIAFRAGNPLVVHHAIITTAPAELADELAESAGMATDQPLRQGLPRTLLQARRSFADQRFGVLGGWAPGSTPFRYPDGVGVALRKGSALILRMHYAPSGKPETDQSEVGIYFSRSPISNTAGSIGLNVVNLNIPPGESKHRVTTFLTLPVDVTLLGIGPHMHLLGREMKVTATKPDGTVEPLIWVRDWDWNWQGQYRFAESIRLPRGTRLELEAIYDNSPANVANPNSPPQPVHFGRNTTDEMCLCFLQVALEDPADQQLLRRAAMRNVFRQFGGRF